MTQTTGGTPNSNNAQGPNASAGNNTQQQVTSPMPSISSNAIANCSACEYGASRSYGRHGGVDIVAPKGTTVVAPIAGRVKYVSPNWYSDASDSGTGMVGIVSDQPSGQFPAGTLFASGHLESFDVSEGTRVEPGRKVGTVGSLGGTDHNHFYIYDYTLPPGDAGTDQNGNVDPTEWVRAAMNGTPLPTTGGTGTSSASSGGTLDESVAKAAAFATYFNIDGLFDIFESPQLTGEKSLMNDKPLFPFIEQLCSASLRRFQSMPNGDFFAFYPDYFGGSGHRTPYWEIQDTEIIDGQIQLSDDSLATNVFVVGDVTGMWDGIDINDKINSAGSINLFNAFQANFITGHGDQQRPESEEISKEVIDKDAAVKFLKKYGARPYYEEMAMVRTPFFEAFLAFQKFCLLWSQQFATTFHLTFMPELFPGGIVKMPQHNLQLFVEEVTHTFDFEYGFNTDVVFSSPASLDKTGKEHEGMIRGGVLKAKE